MKSAIFTDKAKTEIALTDTQDLLIIRGTLMRVLNDPDKMRILCGMLNSSRSESVKLCQDALELVRLELSNR